MKTLDNNKVLVAMSGGVDSSVVAVLLKKQGYEVIGVTMKTWDFSCTSGGKKETGCCSLESFNDARGVAMAYGFPHYVLDLREVFQGQVIDNFVSEYMSGRTPNPCILCNTYIKWDALLSKADSLGCAYIATGHYARIRYEGNRYMLMQGVDKTKDQSYVLWGLSQQVLARTLFPLGDFLKTETRAMAEDLGLREAAQKKDSYEICFIPDNDYRAFLSAKAGHKMGTLKGGTFQNKEGKILGTHDGYPFFTIGQRRKLGQSFGKPVFVTDIKPRENVVVLGEESDLIKNGIFVRRLNSIKYAVVPLGRSFLLKVRYRDRGTMAEAEAEEGGRIKLQAVQGIKGVAPGQSAVFYEGEDVVGGGFIEGAF